MIIMIIKMMIIINWMIIITISIFSTTCEPTDKDSHRWCLDKDIVLDFRKRQLSLRKLFLEKIKTKSMDYHVPNNTVQYDDPIFANCPTSWLIVKAYKLACKLII